MKWDLRLLQMGDSRGVGADLKTAPEGRWRERGLLKRKGSAGDAVRCSELRRGEAPVRGSVNVGCCHLSAVESPPPSGRAQCKGDEGKPAQGLTWGLKTKWSKMKACCRAHSMNGNSIYLPRGSRICRGEREA